MDEKEKKEENKDVNKEEHTTNKRSSQLFSGVLPLGTKSSNEKEKQDKKRKKRR